MAEQSAQKSKPFWQVIGSHTGYVYLVKEGDSLWTIAHKTMGDATLWPMLARLNHIDSPYRILVGQVLYIPPHYQPSSGPKMGNLAAFGKAQGVTGARLEPMDSLQATKAHAVKGTQQRTRTPPRARRVRLPTIKIDLENLPKYEATIAGVRCEVDFTGEVVIKTKKTIKNFDNLTFSKKGFEQEYKKEVTGKFLKWASDVKLDWDLKSNPPRVGISVGGSVENTKAAASWHSFGSRVALTSTRVAYEFSMSAKPVRGEIDEYVFEGKMGVKVTLSFDPRKAVDLVKKGAAVALVAAAVVLVVGTIIEDVASGGIGIADDPISFATAAQLIRWAGQLAPKLAPAW